jgi:pimeloyl-ACP methyl ester carboxylesterase
MPIVTVGPVQLYYEVRGSGPPVLFIMGATGDAGHFSTVAEQLADEFTAVTYDRRGNSRSSRPLGWDTTTVEEQADDAAGLLRALELAPAAVFGSSSGAICALSLLVRHPELVRGAILHEPPMLSVLGRQDDVQAAIGRLVETPRRLDSCASVGESDESAAGRTGQRREHRSRRARPRPLAEVHAVLQRLPDLEGPAERADPGGGRRGARHP